MIFDLHRSENYLEPIQNKDRSKIPYLVINPLSPRFILFTHFFGAEHPVLNKFWDRRDNSGD